MLWESQPRSMETLPEVIVVPDGELRSFLAWTSTYLDGFRPFTSLCRAIEMHTFESIRDAEPLIKFEEIGPACAAIILADALTQGLGKVDQASISIAACESTFSFVRARFIAAGVRDDSEVLPRRWLLAREIGRQPQRRLSPESSEPLWYMLEAIAGSSRSRYHGSPNLDLYHLCREYMATGSITEDRLQPLLRSSSRISTITNAMTETREQRVTVLDEVLRRTELRNMQGLEGDLVRGYIASLLSPGTIEYLALVASYLDEHPLLLMWYAFFAGLHPESKVLSQFGGLCRRLLKDVEQRDLLFERPRCDIAIEELEVLAATGPNGLTYLRGGSQTSVRVELYPTITAPVRISVSPADQRSLFDASSQRYAEDGGRPHQDSDPSSDLAAAMNLLEGVYAKLSGRARQVDDRTTEKRKRGKRR
jgi:hypothetical protein